MSDKPKPAPSAITPAGPVSHTGGPALWLPLYLILALQGSLLAVGIYLPMKGFERYLYGFPVLLLASALAVNLLRDLLHDWLLSVRPIERVRLYFLIVAAFCIPAFLQDHTVIPEGFIFCAPLILFLAFSYQLTQFFLVFIAVGFWATLPRWGVNEVPAALGFGAITLWGFAAAHFAYVGAPFGLRGWWGIRKPFSAAILYTLPAGAVAWVVSRFWPAGGATATNGSAPRPKAISMADAMRSMNKVDWTDLAVQLGKLAAVMIGSFVLLIYLRRYFATRAQPRALPQILGTDVGAFEYETTEPTAARPALEGDRAAIVQLWRRWERRAAEAGLPRALPETAREHADRVDESLDALQAPHSPDREAMIRLLEEAHYGREEPGPAETKRMKQLVDRNIADLNK